MSDEVKFTAEEMENFINCGLAVGPIPDPEKIRKTMHFCTSNCKENGCRAFNSLFSVLMRSLYT